MVNLDNFFDSDEGKSVRQIEIENLYVSKGIDLEPVFKEALIETIRNPTPIKYRGRGFMANHMNWNLIGMLKETYPDYMEIDSYKRDYFLLEKNVRIYFKKLDSKNRPSNIITKHVAELNSMQLFYHNETTILYGGFRLRSDKHWDDITCNLLEMKNLKQPNWVSSLEDLAYTIAKNKLEQTPMFKANLPEQIIIRAKNADDKDLGKTGE